MFPLEPKQTSFSHAAFASNNSCLICFSPWQGAFTSFVVGGLFKSSRCPSLEAFVQIPVVSSGFPRRTVLECRRWGDIHGNCHKQFPLNNPDWTTNDDIPGPTNPSDYIHCAEVPHFVGFVELRAGAKTVCRSDQCDERMRLERVQTKISEIMISSGFTGSSIIFLLRT
ncbi:uncharacterized protein BCR38DRAFT_431234 [Pseudomassariella vexata]|uniref:Uncharacterized protein n=1 Tax=Pseudomassariella vexata TaxID=1141098 RepID=A0A1Y2E030_9PEZI|nr:uncharacterized protein BCR38DRAFT_431234 [Pseudomassariella vexata]ORY64892.1 hypothetical protein BCR38DRAFT_431234 [Pseudomassariella vexata]